MSRNDITDNTWQKEELSHSESPHFCKPDLATLISVPGKYNSFADCPDKWS
jgi:hypothetical protein